MADYYEGQGSAESPEGVEIYKFAARPRLYVDRGTRERPRWVEVGEVLTFPEGTTVCQIPAPEPPRPAGLLALLSLPWRLWEQLEAWADGG